MKNEIVNFALVLPVHLNKYFESSRLKEKETTRILLNTYSSFCNSTSQIIKEEICFLDRELRILLDWEKIAKEGVQMEATLRDIEEACLKASALFSLLDKNKQIG